MKVRRLRWLALVGLLGFLGFPLKQDLYFGLFGLFAFVVLFWYDERSEANFCRATAVAFTAALVGIAAGSVYLAIRFGPGCRYLPKVTDQQLATIGIQGFALVLGLLVIGFAASYVYFEFRGD